MQLLVRSISEKSRPTASLSGHVMVAIQGRNDPALIELIGNRALPRLREVTATDPRPG
jgi:hypothetical protein